MDPCTEGACPLERKQEVTKVVSLVQNHRKASRKAARVSSPLEKNIFEVYKGKQNKTACIVYYE